VTSRLSYATPHAQSFRKRALFGNFFEGVANDILAPFSDLRNCPLLFKIVSWSSFPETSHAAFRRLHGLVPS